MLTSSREEALKRACVKLPGTESIPLSPGVCTLYRASLRGTKAVVDTTYQVTSRSVWRRFVVSGSYLRCLRFSSWPCKCLDRLDMALAVETSRLVLVRITRH